MHKPTIKVFFNSACPVCRAGITSQKKKMQSCPVEWKDVHLDNSLVQGLDADLEFVRERLHVIDENGHLHIGLDAFVAIWQTSPNETWKATVASLPILHTVLNMFYNVFANVLYKWNRVSKHW